MPKPVEVNKTLRGRMNFKGRLLQKQTNSATKLQKNVQIYDQKKTSAKIVQKSDLGGSWAPFGKGLGRSGASWGHFWAHFDCLLGVPNHIFLKQWSKMGSKRPFGWLLDRFWEGLGRIWMRLGRIWAFKIKAFASHGHFLNTLGVPCCLTLCYRNPRVASLRLAERHNRQRGA